MDVKNYMLHDAENIKGFAGDYRWLSNFHKCTIFFDGYEFPSTENAYVYAKIAPDKLEAFTDLIDTLRTCPPSEAKSIGKTITTRLEWDKVKLDVMSAVVFDKFYRHKDLRKKLLATGHKHIEETNHWGDTYWGVCEGKGKNHLGKVLMSVRSYWATHYPGLLGKKEVEKLF